MGNRRESGIWRLAAACSATLLCCLLFSSAVAERSEAAESPTYLSSFGPDGSSSSDFGMVGAVAVDQQSGAVYAIDVETGTLHKFGPAGEALDFGGTASYIFGDEITGLSFFA